MNYEQALTNFLLKLSEREENHIKKNFKNLTPRRFEVDRGRKFDKIVTVGNQVMVYCFVKKETGGIVKAASWKAPEPKQYERGNIYNDNPLEGTNEYGVNYIK